MTLRSFQILEPQNTDMRLESGTCNVCSAPCSSCMHLNHAVMESKDEEFSDENCRVGEANYQYSMDEDNAYSLRNRACESSQHTVSEASNMQSVNSSHDALSENAESKQITLNKHQDSKQLEGHDDNTSCISRASDANLVNGGHKRNEERIIMHVERDSCSDVPAKSAECSIENSSSPSTKKREPVVSGEKCIGVKDHLIVCASNISLKVCPKSESVADICHANNEDPKCSVQVGQREKAQELAKSPGKQEPQSEDESDESDVVEHDVKVCDICGDAGREDLLAICSSCSDGAEHTYCMREMLEKVPEGNWLCEECKDAEENENNRLDVEDNKIVEVSSASQVSGKRISDNIEVAPAAKRQALESSTGSPKTSSPKRLVPLSRESSFKSLDKSKVKSGLLMPIRNHSGGIDTEIARTGSIGPWGQNQKGILLKCNSFNNLNSKPRVKLDEVVPQKSKEGNEHTSKNVEMSSRMTGKSTLFKSSSLGRSNAAESKVKMLSPKYVTTQDLKGSRQLKESGALDRKFPSRNDRPVASSVVSTPKGDQKLTPPAETNKPSAINNNRELKVNQDGKSSALSRSMNNISHRSLEPQDSSERTSTRVDEAQQDLLPRSCEAVNLVEKSRDRSSDLGRPVVPISSKNLFCKKCKEFGHSLKCCTDGSTLESGAEVSVTASTSSKEEMDKDNILKAAIQAVLRRPKIYKKKEVSNQTDEVSTSGTELNCEVTSKDQVLVAITLKNTISADETHEQQEILENSTSDSSKCSSTNDLKQLNSCPTDLWSQPGNSDSISLAAGKSVVRDLSNLAVTMSSVPLKILAFPEYEYTWQGIFEVHRNGKPPDLYTGLQAHLSSCASPKVVGVVNKFLPNVPLNEVSRLSTWPSQFHHGVCEDSIALYFFARDVESYERHYKGLLDHMIRNDLALKGNFDGVELLIFPSNQLPENSQRWNMLFYLWGVFRGKKINNSDSAKKIRIPSLNLMSIEEKTSTAVLTMPEANCLPKCKDEESIDCDKACNVLLPSTAIDLCQITGSRDFEVNDQTHLGSLVNLEKLDSMIDSKSTPKVPTDSTLSCQEMNSTNSSLKASVLEQEQCKESKPPEAMGKSASSRIVETRTDTDISIKQDNTLSLIPSKKGDASNIIKDKISEKMNSDEDQKRSKKKRKEDCPYIDLKANIDNQETGAASNFSKDKNSVTIIVDEDQQRPKRKRQEYNYIDLEATFEDQETGTIICEDKFSEKMDVEEDLRGLKMKRKDDNFIDLEEAFQGDQSADGIHCQLSNDKVKHADLSDTFMHGSSVSCQRMPWSKENIKLENRENSGKKLKTGFAGIYGSGDRDSFNDSFKSLGNDLGSCSSIENKGCEEACDEKIIREDSGTMERTFFPVGTQNSNSLSVLNSMSTEVVDEYNEGFQERIPNLELALGGKTEPPLAAPKGMLPFLLGAVDRQNNRRPNGLGDWQEEDGVAASLSLSLSFPSPNKEHTKAAELLPDGQRVNNSFILFGRK